MKKKIIYRSSLEPFNQSWKFVILQERSDFMSLTSRSLQQIFPDLDKVEALNNEAFRGKGYAQ